MTTSGRVGGAHPSLVDGALLGREGMGSGGVSASSSWFVISFLLFPTLPSSPSLPLLMTQINSAITGPTKMTQR